MKPTEVRRRFSDFLEDAGRPLGGSPEALSGGSEGSMG
jgi:hypothetical protein